MEIMAQNCRISHATIARALRISKDTVTYKLNALEQDGFLGQYMAFVDARKLGFTRYHFLLKFQAGIADRKLMYEKVISHPAVMWMNTFIGRFDLQIIVDAKDGFHLDAIREELFALCDHKVQEYEMLMHVCDLEFTQLNPVLDLQTGFERKDDASFGRSMTTRNFPVSKSFDRYPITALEVELLKALADNPKASLIDLGKQVGVDRSTVKKHMARLIEHGVLLGCLGIPNMSQLGFVTYYLLVRVVQDTPLAVLRKPFEKLQNIFYAGKMIGDHDMILYLNARNPDELYSSIELFKKAIEEHIIHYDLLVQDKVYYWRQFTPGIYAELGKRF